MSDPTIPVILAVLTAFAVLVAFIIGAGIDEGKRKDAGQVYVRGWVNAEDFQSVHAALRRAQPSPDQQVEK